ncbi:MAG: hypothetical protein LCH37_14880 [Bacteroidetes bacterium]|nr:hypothetical protein [Bacteroidota bacterium]
MYKIMIGGYLQTSGNAANSDKLADADIFRNSGNSNDPLQDLKLDFSNSAETSKKENVQG